MSDKILSTSEIATRVRPIAEKYRVQAVYLFGSYARGEADETSDLDFLVFGGEHFKPTLIFAFAEELRAALEKEIDVFEISEINTDSVFYDTIMKERLQVA